MQHNNTATPCKENKHTEADVARSRNNSSDDLLCTEQSKVRVINLKHFPPPTADMHIYNCMLASTMHVWPAKQPLINKGLRQWLPSGVRNSSHHFSLTPSLSLSPSLVCLSARLSICLSVHLPFFPKRRMDVAAPARMIHTLDSICFPRNLFQNIGIRPLGHTYILLLLLLLLRLLRRAAQRPTPEPARPPQRCWGPLAGIQIRFRLLALRC